MTNEPSPTDGNGTPGKGADGRFRPGNKLAVGNPHARAVARLRSAMLKAVEPGDVRAIITRLVADGVAGMVSDPTKSNESLKTRQEVAKLKSRLVEVTARVQIGQADGGVFYCPAPLW